MVSKYNAAREIMSWTLRVIQRPSLSASPYLSGNRVIPPSFRIFTRDKFGFSVRVRACILSWVPCSGVQYGVQILLIPFESCDHNGVQRHHVFCRHHRLRERELMSSQGCQMSSNYQQFLQRRFFKLLLTKNFLSNPDIFGPWLLKDLS